MKKEGVCGMEKQVVALAAGEDENSQGRLRRRTGVTTVDEMLGGHESPTPRRSRRANLTVSLTGVKQAMKR